VIVIDNGSQDNSMDYMKAWAKGKLDVWVSPDNPLRKLSYPPVCKPIPYVHYTREEAEKGGNPEKERGLALAIKDNSTITTQYPLILIQIGNNLGFAGGNNVGIRYVLKKDDSDCILFLNNDTVVDQFFLSILINTMKNANNVAALTGKIYFYDRPKTLWYAGGKINWIKGAHSHFGEGKRDTGQYDIQRLVTFISGCCMLLDVKKLGKASLLSENYFLGAEDYYFSWYIRKLGYSIIYVPEAKLWHKVGRSRQNRTLTDIYYSYASRLIFMRSVLPLPIWWLWILVVAIYGFLIAPWKLRFLEDYKNLDLKFCSIQRAIFQALKHGITKKTVNPSDFLK
jgi:hypothetical protein